LSYLGEDSFKKKGNEQMIKKSILVCLTIAVVSAIVACGSKTDANAKNFAPPISQFLEKSGELCIYERFGMFGMEWPMDIYNSPFSAHALKENQLNALISVGLVTKSDAEIKIPAEVIFGPPKFNIYKAKRFTLTETGKKYLRSADSNICYGKLMLDKVVKWEGPKKDGDYQEALVKFTYQIKDQADWAKSPAVLAAFPQIKETLDGAGKNELPIEIKLTSQGWESKR
jgi:hypothetical protein